MRMNMLHSFIVMHMFMTSIINTSMVLMIRQANRIPTSIVTSG